MNSPTVAVVMPVHDGMPFLVESIQSVLDQSFRQFEFIIGDDGSTDGSSARLEQFARADARIRIIRRAKKSGVAASLNWVMSATKADFVAIAHADDLSFPDRLKLQVEALQRRPDASAVAALSRHVDRKNRVIQPTGYWRLFRHSPFAPFAHSSLMVRRSLFQQVGGYREQANYWEDLDLYWRLLDVGPILVLPEVLTSYRHSDVSIRSRDEAQYVEDALDLMYRCAALHSAGLNHSDLLMSGRSPEARVNPRIFIARSWTSVWQNRRPGTVRRFLQRGDIRFDRRSLGSLAFVLAGTLSPRLVALGVQGWMRALDATARLRMRARASEPFEWASRDSDTKPVSSLASPPDRPGNEPGLLDLESRRSLG